MDANWPDMELEPTLTVSLRFLAGVVAGALATLAMDQVMARLPEGTTPQFVAAGVLTDRPPAEAPPRLATAVHYLSGLLTGPLFVWLLLVSEGLFGGQSAATAAAAGVVLYGLMVGFFAVVVLPQSRVAANRVGTIRRDWSIAAASYLAVLVALVWAVSGVL